MWFRVPDLGAAVERTTSANVPATTVAEIQTAATPVSILVSSTAAPLYYGDYSPHEFWEQEF